MYAPATNVPEPDRGRRDFLAGATSVGALAALPACAARTPPASSDRVRVRQGWLQGQSTSGISRFLGVPFAQPPVGWLRWHWPLPLAPWEGTRDATQFGACCEQGVSGLAELPIDRSRFTPEQLERLRQRWGVVADMRAERSEDCLYLNVWTHSLDADASQPVMVWIHGGGNLRGAGSETAYDGTSFARDGVTLVTINYRLGAFGFLVHPKLGANFGLLEQIAALQWVQENIRSFGGDPGNVTLFGESAGAANIRALLLCPGAKGPFHRVALESAGFEVPANGRSWSTDRSGSTISSLLRALGGGEPNDWRRVPAHRVVAEASTLAFVAPGEGEIPTPANLVWMPVPDGDVMREEQFPAWSADIPLLLGFNQNESRYFLRPQIRYTPVLVRAMAHAFCPGRADKALELLAPYGDDHFAALDALFTAAIFSEPALQMARRFSGLGARVFLYHFTRVSPGARQNNKLAQHTAEIRYLIGHLDSESGDAYDDADLTVSREMRIAWTQFARSGVPRSPTGESWPRFDWSTRRVTTLGTTEQPTHSHSQALQPYSTPFASDTPQWRHVQTVRTRRQPLKIIHQFLAPFALVSVATASSAQSGVTLYGGLDLSLRSVKNGSAGTIRSMSSGNSIASRWGLLGREDLGDGSSVRFQLESDIAPDTGIAGSTSTSFSSYFNRRSILSLINVKFGELRIGREYAPTHFTFCFYEAFGCIGLGGTKMSFDNSAPTYVGTSSVLGAAFGTAAGPTASQNPTMRVNNSVQYLLPDGLWGLNGAVMVAPGEGAPTSANGASRTYGGRLGYSAGPAMVNVATMKTTNTLVAGQSFKDVAVMGSYDFRILKLYAAQRRYTFMSEKMVQTVLNATVPVGLGLVKVSYATANQSSAVVSRSADDATLFAVGYDYSLSKRTGLYATAARLGNKGHARYFFVGGPTNIAAGDTALGYEVGVRHAF